MKRAFVLFILLAVAAAALAQGSAYNDLVLNQMGRPVANAAVRVCDKDALGTPCSPLATIYTDGTLQTVRNQTTTPLTSDALGRFVVYGLPGWYKVQVSGGGITTREYQIVLAGGLDQGNIAAVLAAKADASALAAHAALAVTHGATSTIVGVSDTQALTNKTLDATNAVDAAAVKSGTLATARIPGLDASKIISGVFPAGYIPALDAAKVTSGTFDGNRIPALDATKIASGAFNNARINWAAPAAIGSTTPQPGSFTALTVTASVSQGSGVKHQRFGSSCTVAAGVGSVCGTTYTWASAFADSDYTVSCTLDGPAPSGVPVISNILKSASAVTVWIANLSSSVSTAAPGVECIAFHD